MRPPPSISRPMAMYYQMPWKTNPVMILYNTAMFEEAGLDPENPPLGTYEDFAATAADPRRFRCRRGRHLPVADIAVLPVVVRLLPMVRRRDRAAAGG